MRAMRGGLVAAFLAGVLGAGLVVAVTGGYRRGGSATTVVVRSAQTDSGGAATVVSDITAARFDPRRIYRERAAGVVTIDASVPGSDVTGSGFVVSATGDIVTNAHVVTNSPDARRPEDVRAGTSIYVLFQDGNSLPAKIVGFDLYDDIAVVHVDPRREPLTVLTFGSAASLSVGDPLAVIGSPFGAEQEQSLSTGVVSGLGREIDPPAHIPFKTPGAIQTDAAITHGNSGGPVFDARGRVVGVAAQISTSGGGGEGVGFAIPAEAAQRSYRELVRTGKVQYAWLGVSTYPVSRELARQFGLPVMTGLLVDGVTSGGPAAQAGLSAGRRTAAFQDAGPIHPDGDIIVAFDGHRVRTSGDLTTLVALSPPGKAVPVEVLRAGKRLTITVTLATRPASLAQ
jgi:S1-C subfamily serine protease